jgi:hypothetical protein
MVSAMMAYRAEHGDWPPPGKLYDGSSWNFKETTGTDTNRGSDVYRLFSGVEVRIIFEDDGRVWVTAIND